MGSSREESLGTVILNPALGASASKGRLPCAGPAGGHHVELVAGEPAAGGWINAPTSVGSSAHQPVRRSTVNELAGAAAQSFLWLLFTRLNRARASTGPTSDGSA